MQRRLAFAWAVGLAAALAPSQAAGAALGHAGRGRAAQPKKGADTEALVASLNKVVKSLVSEQDTAKAAANALDKECKDTLGNYSAPNKAIRKGKSRVERATGDLKDIESSMAAVQTRIDGFSSKIEAAMDNIAELTAKLGDLREKQKKSDARAAATLSQLDSVISKVEWEKTHRKHNGASQLSTEVSALRRLGRQLSAVGGDEAPAASFLQTAAAPEADGLAKLADDRLALFSASKASKKSAKDEEQRLIDLIKEKRAELGELQASLKEQRPLLADKLKQAAETNRTISMARRVIDRDTASLAMTKEVCDLRSEAGVKINKLRATLINAVKVPAVLIEHMDTTLFLERDMRGLRAQLGATESFVQLRAAEETEAEGPSDEAQVASLATMLQQGAVAAAGAASGAAGPLDNVIGMIRNLMSTLRDQGNEDTNLHQWCMESKEENENSRFEVQGTVNSAESEMLFAKAAMAKLKDDIAFFEEEMPRLKEEESKVKATLRHEKDTVFGYAKTHQEDMRLLLGVLKVLQKSCDLKLDADIKVLQEHITATWQLKDSVAPAASLLQRSVARGSQCQEAGSLLVKAGMTLVELGEAIVSFHNDYSEKLVAQTGVAKDAYSQRSKDLQAAQAALSKRANDFAVAEADRKEGVASLELVEQAKRSIEQKCIVRQSHGERMAQRQDEVEALEKALRALNGEEILVGTGLLATGAQGQRRAA